MPLIQYQDCTEAELIKFSQDRRLTVLTRTLHVERVDNYISALRAADEACIFPLMDLAPELRNRIYRELLLFHNSYYCQPGILATCKQITQEATKILYRDNLVEVKLQNVLDGSRFVHAHGHPCFRPPKTARPPKAATCWDGDVAKLQWPSFLRRAQWIRFSSHPGWDRHHDSANYVLYSLCSFLREDHDMVAIEVDAGVPVTMHGVLSPLQLLGPLKLIRIINHGRPDITMENMTFPSGVILQGIASAAMHDLMEEVGLCIGLSAWWELLDHEPRARRRSAPTHHRLLRDVVSASDQDIATRNLGMEWYDSAWESRV
ncbi:hypothetical protein LTR53_018008, partial [Teratosphaeriaceae sp. CCFEE 6253]